MPLEFMHLTRPLLAPDDQPDEIVPGAPAIHPSDLGVTRGYGAFEVVHGSGNRLLALDHHLERFDRSLAQLSLPALNRESWLEAITRILEIPSIDPEADLALRLVVTAGSESAPPVGWVHRYAPEPELRELRNRPHSARLLNRATKLGESRSLPWLLHGVKSLSYAGNLTGERIAASDGFDDAIYVTRDGYLLEGPTSSFVWLRDSTLYTTDFAEGVLPGTTQRAIFDAADRLGLSTATGVLPASELAEVDGAWLMSALRLATALGTIDGQRIAHDLTLTARMNDLLYEAMVQPTR